MTEATNSFEIRTARQFFDEVLRPAYAGLLADSLSSRKAVTCAIFAWHLHDWIWAQHKSLLQAKLGVDKKGFVKFLVSQCHELEAVQDLANGSKHFQCDGSTVGGTELSHGHASGLSLAITQSHLVVQARGAKHFVENLLHNVLDFWAGFIANVLPPETSSPTP